MRPLAEDLISLSLEVASYLMAKVRDDLHLWVPNERIVTYYLLYLRCEVLLDYLLLLFIVAIADARERPLVIVGRFLRA